MDSFEEVPFPNKPFGYSASDCHYLHFNHITSIYHSDSQFLHSTPFPICIPESSKPILPSAPFSALQCLTQPLLYEDPLPARQGYAVLRLALAWYHRNIPLEQLEEAQTTYIFQPYVVLLLNNREMYRSRIVAYDDEKDCGSGYILLNERLSLQVYYPSSLLSIRIYDCDSSEGVVANDFLMGETEIQLEALTNQHIYDFEISFDVKLGQMIDTTGRVAQQNTSAKLISCLTPSSSAQSTLIDTKKYNICNVGIPNVGSLANSEYQLNYSPITTSKSGHSIRLFLEIERAPGVFNEICAYSLPLSKKMANTTKIDISQIKSDTFEFKEHIAQLFSNLYFMIEGITSWHSPVVSLGFLLCFCIFYAFPFIRPTMLCIFLCAVAFIACSEPEIHTKSHSLIDVNHSANSSQEPQDPSLLKLESNDNLPVTLIRALIPSLIDSKLELLLRAWHGRIRLANAVFQNFSSFFVYHKLLILNVTFIISISTLTYPKFCVTLVSALFLIAGVILLTLRNPLVAPIYRLIFGILCYQFKKFKVIHYTPVTYGIHSIIPILKDPIQKNEEENDVTEAFEQKNANAVSNHCS